VLERALSAWRDRRDARELRRALAALLVELE
jgi:hypothetical protein